MATYIYTRVSTDEQVVGCAVQEAVSRKACQDQALGAPTVIADDGVSTSKVKFKDRPGMKHLLSILRPGDHLVVYRLDRIERGFLTFFDALQQLIKREVWIHSVEEKSGKSLDLSTATGRAMLAVWAIAADFYREAVQNNTREALQFRKRNGYAYTRPPFGWKVQEVSPRPDGRKPLRRFEPIDPATIDEIVERMDHGESPYSIATDFKNQGRRCDGRLWAPWKNHSRYADCTRVLKAYRYAKYLQNIMEEQARAATASSMKDGRVSERGSCDASASSP